MWVVCWWRDTYVIQFVCCLGADRGHERNWIKEKCISHTKRKNYNQSVLASQLWSLKFYKQTI